MAGPRIAERYKYMTLPQAARRLGMHQAKLRRRLKAGVFPSPSFVNKHGLNFFDEDWIKESQAILVNSFEGKNSEEALEL
ncbi:unnamed protein product [marine sediment metagenome]|uniref:Helix-turn-helix domain-containing protein n=1 Tax=marine sediment metagenome TaxID=412755 RepID=X1EQ72_9ZZZZ